MWAFNGLCSIFRREGDRRIQLKTLDIFEGKIDIKFVLWKTKKEKKWADVYGIWIMDPESQIQA